MVFGVVSGCVFRQFCTLELRFGLNVPRPLGFLEQTSANWGEPGPIFSVKRRVQESILYAPLTAEIGKKPLGRK
jgi:hypothetical protein